MLSPLDYEGAILQKEMEVEQREASNELLELTDDFAPATNPVRLSLARLLVGIGLRLDPAVVVRLTGDSLQDSA